MTIVVGCLTPSKRLRYCESGTVTNELGSIQSGIVQLAVYLTCLCDNTVSVAAPVKVSSLTI